MCEQFDIYSSNYPFTFKLYEIAGYEYKIRHELIERVNKYARSTALVVNAFVLLHSGKSVFRLLCIRLLDFFFRHQLLE